MDPLYGNLTDDDLLSLARSAGVLPQEEVAQVPEVPEDPAIEMPPPEEEGRQDFRTWVPRQLGFTPNYDAPEVSGAPKNVSAGMSASGSGFSKEKYAQVKATEPGLTTDLRAADERAYAGAEQMAVPLQDAHASSIEGTQAVADATARKIDEEGRQALVIQRLQDDFAAEEAKMNAEAQGMANQAKADYLAALNDFRAARVDPSQLWKNMTGGERFGTLMSAFVHDFLGAKGINTSAMATLNKAIDRNIDAQLQAIRTKGEAAEGFKSLWWMQRNQAQSDAEARSRVRGFLLEGAKQAVIANMASYESALASAQGKAAIAEIDKEFAKNLISVFQHADQNAIALRNQAIDKWRIGIQAANESYGLALRKQEIEQRERLAKQQQTGPKLIHDPESGQAVGFFQPGISQPLEDEARKKFVDTYVTSQAIKTLRDIMRRQPAAFDLTSPTRLGTTDQQMYDSAATRLAHQMVKALGERATDKDVDQMIKGLRAKTIMNRGDAERVLAFTEEEIIKPAQALYSGVAYDLPPDSPLRSIRSGDAKSILEGSRSEAGNTANPPAPTSDEILRKGAHEIITGPQGKVPLPESDVSSEVKNAHKEAEKQYPHLFTQGQKETLVSGTNETRPTYSEKGMVDLRRLARKGDKSSKEQLEAIARPYLSGVNTEDKEAAFAALMLSTMDEDPEPVRGEEKVSPAQDAETKRRKSIGDFYKSSRY